MKVFYFDPYSIGRCSPMTDVKMQDMKMDQKWRQGVKLSQWAAVWNVLTYILRMRSSWLEQRWNTAIVARVESQTYAASRL